MKGIPLLTGSALKNVGIQSLLTAICNYLPSPLDRRPVMAHYVSFRLPPSFSRKNKKGRIRRGDLDRVESSAVFGENHYLNLDQNDKNPSLIALAFKVQFDLHRGFIVWVRVYTGFLKKNMEIWNTNKNVVEKVIQLYKIDASSIEPIDFLNAGDIGAVIGLSGTSTGHTLMNAGGKTEFKNGVQICRPEFLPPVYMQTIEPETLVDQPDLVSFFSYTLFSSYSIYSISLNFSNFSNFSNCFSFDYRSIKLFF